MKKCPFCAEEIQDAAIKCRYCGSQLSVPASSAATTACPFCRAVVPLGSKTCPSCHDDISGIASSEGPDADKFADVRKLARVGKRTEAIKLLRDKTAWGLKEAEDFVDKVPLWLPTRAPTESRGGWLIAVLIFGVIGYFAYHLGDFLTPTSPRPSAQTAPAAAPVTRPAPAPVQNKAAADSARVAVDKMVNLGLIKRMDVKTGRFYIDGPLWEGFELDAKENIVKVISGYRKAEYQDLPQVRLYESRSGKELASYGAFSGVTIK